MMTETSIPGFPPAAVGQIGGETVQTINARDLHAFLGVGKDFSTWFKDRVRKLGFVEGVDFAGLSPEIGEQVYQGVSVKKEYVITVRMAKHLSMVERNEQGKRVRKYFIEAERRAKIEMERRAAATVDPTQG